MKIKEENGKLIFYDFMEPNENVEFTAENVETAINVFENVLSKLDRYNRLHEGWEHITWVGFYKLFPDDKKEEGIKIIEKYKELINNELNILIKDDIEEWDRKYGGN